MNCKVSEIYDIIKNMMKKGDNLNKLFNPKSLAIVGASQNEEKIGNIIIKNIEKSGYEGRIFLINPNYASVGNHECFPSYADLPQTPDLAILAIPADKVIKALEQIGEKGTKQAVIFAAGFREAGKEGEELEEFLKNVAEEYKMNILGPNCLGFLSTPAKLNATFARVESLVGNVRFAAQSGALASAIFDWAEDYGLGFKEFITLGNKAIVSENQILDYWLGQRPMSLIKKRSQTKKGFSSYEPIGLYLESINDGKEFLNKARELSKTNPVILLKPGRSAAAKSAMQSHTGSIAGDDKVLDAVLLKAGIIRVEGANELFNITRAFAWENAPQGPNVAIISNAGGPAVIATDRVVQCGLKFAEFEESTKKLLLEILPRYASIHNPVDVLGDAPPSRYEKTLDAILADKNVHSAIVILTPQSMTKIEETAELISRLSKKYEKPVLCSFMGGRMIRKGEEILNAVKIPNFRYPENAVQVLGKMWKWISTDRANEVSKQSPGIKSGKLKRIQNFIKQIQEERNALNGFEVSEIFKEAEITCPAYDLIQDLSSAKGFADKHGYPVVLKIVSSQIFHKTEEGGVIVNIDSEKALENALHQMQKVAAVLKNKKIGCEIMIQKQIQGGVEVIIGMKKDPSFGRVLLFGPGGTLAELMEDNHLLELPVEKRQVERMIASSKIGKILNGYRNGKKYNLKKLVKLIMTFASISENTDSFSEIEINPVIVTENDAYAVDGKAVLNI